jgi:NADH dehydrogenase FAD-containing subunit
LRDTAPRILPAEDELVSQTITRRFQLQGIRVITGIASIQAIVPDAQFGLRLHYTQHGEERTIPIASVIMAVGWVGNADQLNLAAAQVETERSYIKVNDALQTSAPHIYAAGDITGQMRYGPHPPVLSGVGFLWEGRASARPPPVLVREMVSGAAVAVGRTNRIPMRSGEKVYT